MDCSIAPNGRAVPRRMILLIDHEASVRDVLQVCLDDLGGWNVKAASTIWQGLINLFPIPLLDGGHLVFYAYEAVFKKPMSEKVMDYALKFGMVFLIGLMAFANINDIVQIVL